MGIKFKAKTSPGDIASGDIPERELFFDFNRNIPYTSTNGTDVVKLVPDDLVGGGMEYDSTREYEEGTLVTVSTALPGGISTDEEYISMTDNNLGNDPLTDTTNWRLYNVVKWINQDIVIDIGVGGDFLTIVDALNTLSKYKMVDTKKITLRLKSGHVIDYNISYSGQDFSGIKIINEIDTDYTSITAGPNSASNDAVFFFENTYAPEFDINMSYDGPPMAADQKIFNLYKNSFMVFSGTRELVSTVTNDPESTSFQIVANSSLFASNSKIRGDKNICVVVSGNSVLQAVGATFSNGENSIIRVFQASKVDILGSSINCGELSATEGVGISANHTSNVNATDVNITESAPAGADTIFVSTGATICISGISGTYTTNISVNTLDRLGIIYE